MSLDKCEIIRVDIDSYKGLLHPLVQSSILSGKVHKCYFCTSRDLGNHVGSSSKETEP